MREQSEFRFGETQKTKQEFLSNFECLSRIQRPGKPQETRFCDSKRSKCNYSENRGTRGRFSSNAQQRLDESRYNVCSLFARHRS